MNHTMLALFGAAIGLYALQAAGAYYQMRQYKRAVHRLHQLGNVGIGQKRGGFSFGYLVLVVCDNNGIIQTVERMRGITKLGLDKSALALRYLIVGLIVMFIRGIVTERIYLAMRSKNA